MLISFKDINTKEVLFSIDSEQMLHVPRVGEGLRYEEKKVGRVVDVEYTFSSDVLSRKPQFACDKIEVFLEVFQQE